MGTTDRIEGRLSRSRTASVDRLAPQPPSPTIAALCRHAPQELNWWLPLTRATGSNSLYVESAPGRKDFAPLELGTPPHSNQAFSYR